MKHLVLVLVILFITSGCEKSHSASVGVTVNSEPKNRTIVTKDGNKLITKTVTVSTKVEELVPPPPVKKVTVTSDTTTSATLNGVPVKPDAPVHEQPSVFKP